MLTTTTTTNTGSSRQPYQNQRRRGTTVLSTQLSLPPPRISRLAFSLSKDHALLIAAQSKPAATREILVQHLINPVRDRGQSHTESARRAAANG